MFTLAHLTDIHLAPLVGFAPRHWNTKRLLGYLNWQRRRKRDHIRAALDALVADLLTQAPDHIAVTGDLVNIGLPLEHVRALEWLQALGPPERVTVVPGNHDIYVRMRPDPGTRRWAAYMSSNAAGSACVESLPDGFPFVRRVGDVALIGLCSAVPTPPFVASGRLGPEQRRALADVLGRLHKDGLFRVVLIHHPPLPGQARPSRGLQDAAELEAILLKCGAELVLHGHNHLNMLSWRHWQAGAVPVVGLPSASMGRRHKGEPLARYNLYRIHVDRQSSRIELISRGLAEPGGPTVEIERRWLTPEFTEF